MPTERTRTIHDDLNEDEEDQRKKRHCKKRVSIIAKNARALKGEDGVEELLTELEDTTWDAVLLSETWRP